MLVKNGGWHQFGTDKINAIPRLKSFVDDNDIDKPSQDDGIDALQMLMSYIQLFNLSDLKVIYPIYNIYNIDFVFNIFVALDKYVNTNKHSSYLVKTILLISIAGVLLV